MTLATHLAEMTGENDLPRLAITKLVNRFKPEFDTDLIAARVADRTHRTPEAVKEEWAEKRKVSRERGKVVHKFIEDYLLHCGEMVSRESGKTHDRIVEEYFAKGDKPAGFETESHAHYCKLFLAWVHDPATGFQFDKPVLIEHEVEDDFLTGRVDLIYHTRSGNKVIADFKTGNKFTGGVDNAMMCDCLLAPLGYIADCDFSIASLQLALYNHLLGGGYEPVIVRLGLTCYETFRASYYREETKLMLDHFHRYWAPATANDVARAMLLDD